MRHTQIFIWTILLTSCFENNIAFEKNYYEKISGIKFPAKYEVLETFDNGEWLTGTVFKMDSMTLRKFVNDNHFDSLQNLQDIHLLSDNYLEKNKPNFTGTKNIYFVSKSIKKNNWTYVADLNNNKLWTEISYPDWSGQ